MAVDLELLKSSIAGLLIALVFVCAWVATP